MHGVIVQLVQLRICLNHRAYHNIKLVDFLKTLLLGYILVANLKKGGVSRIGVKLAMIRFFLYRRLLQNKSIGFIIRQLFLFLNLIKFVLEMHSAIL